MKLYKISLYSSEINGLANRKTVLQELYDTPPLCLFLLLRMFWYKKKYQCIYQIWSNPPIISQDIEHKHNSKINQSRVITLLKSLGK